MRNYLLTLCLFAIATVSGGLLCNKTFESCLGNCTELHVTGTTINRLTGLPQPNVLIQLSWEKPVINIGNNNFVTQSSSNSNGAFNFAASIDTTRFSGESLTMRVLDGTNYVAANDERLKDSLSMRFYNPNAFQNLHLGVYRASNLVLKLRRKQTDSFTNLQVTYQYDEGRIFTAYNTDFPDTFKPQDVTVATAAGVTTSVHLIKGQTNGTFIQNDTTIFCTEDKDNILELNF